MMRLLIPPVAALSRRADAVAPRIAGWQCGRRLASQSLFPNISMQPFDFAANVVARQEGLDRNLTADSRG